MLAKINKNIKNVRKPSPKLSHKKPKFRLDEGAIKYFVSNMIEKTM